MTTLSSKGHKLYLKILQLAALHGENIVSEILEKEFALGKYPSLEKITNQLTVKQEACPDVKVSIIELKLYDTLMQRLFQGASS